MKISKDAFLDIVFQRKDISNLSSYGLNMKTLNVLMAIDGHRSVGTISREDNYDLEFLAEQIQDLLQLGLIESSSSTSEQPNQNFINELNTHFCQLVGPAGNVAIKKVVSNLGHDIDSFPMSLAIELIDQLAKLIPDNEKANAFKRRMTAAIK